MVIAIVAAWSLLGGFLLVCGVRSAVENRREKAAERARFSTDMERVMSAIDTALADRGLQASARAQVHQAHRRYH